MKIHDKEWFETMNNTMPWFAIMAAKSIESNDGDDTGCTVCGDMPAKAHILPTMPRMPAVLLCKDCVQIQADIHDHNFIPTNQEKSE